jgi:hypothetical protein
MSATLAPPSGSLMPKAVLLFLLLLVGLFGAYVASALVLADSLVLRHPTRAGAFHPDLVINAVLALVIAYTLTAAWIGQRWLHAELAALRPVVDAGEKQWEEWSRAILRPRFGKTLLAGLFGGFLGILILVVSTWATSSGPRIWGGHVIWMGLLNASLFAALAVFALRGADADRVFQALGEHARVRIGDVDALAPFARTGLRRALLWLLGSSLAALLLPSTGAPGIVLGIILVTLGIGVASLLAPSRTLHRRMREVKQTELAWLRSEIARAGDALRGHGDPARGLRLPALIAWEARVADAPEWPFDVSTKLRFALLLLVPLGSWLGGAMVERFIDAWFG